MKKVLYDSYSILAPYFLLKSQLIKVMSNFDHRLYGMLRFSDEAIQSYPSFWIFNGQLNPAYKRLVNAWLRRCQEFGLKDYWVKNSVETVDRAMREGAGEFVDKEGAEARSSQIKMIGLRHLTWIYGFLVLCLIGAPFVSLIYEYAVHREQRIFRSRNLAPSFGYQYKVGWRLLEPVDRGMGR